MRLEFAEIKGAKLIWHAKSSTFRAAKLKGFTVTGSATMQRIAETYQENFMTTCSSWGTGTTEMA